MSDHVNFCFVSSAAAHALSESYKYARYCLNTKTNKRDRRRRTKYIEENKKKTHKSRDINGLNCIEFCMKML